MTAQPKLEKAEDGKYRRVFKAESFTEIAREEGKDGKIGTVYIFKGVMSSDIDTGDFHRKYGFNQILSHDSSAVNMTEMREGRMNLLDGHYGQPIGIVRDIELKDGKAHATIAVVDAGDGRQREVIANWQHGVGINLSVGYTVEEEAIKQEGEREIRVATSWTPLEVSLVGIPLDKNAGIGRKDADGGDGTPPEPQPQPEPEATPETETPEKIEPQPKSPEEDDPMTEAAEKIEKPDYAQALRDSTAKTLEASGIKERGVYTNLVERAIANAKKEGRDFTAADEGATTIEVLDLIAKNEDGEKTGVRSVDPNDPESVSEAVLGKGALFADVDLADIASQRKSRLPDLHDAIEVAGGLPKTKTTDQMRAILGEYKQEAAAKGYKVDEDPKAIPIPPSAMIRWKLGMLLKQAMNDNNPSPSRATAIDAMMRAFTVTGDSGTKGAALVQDEIFMNILQETLYASARFAELGLTMLTGMRDNIVIPVQSGKPSLAYYGETATAALSDFTFGTVKLTPHRLAGGADYTYQLSDTTKGGYNIAAFIFGQLMKRLEELRDEAFLDGSGTGANVRGLLNTSNIGTVEMGTNGGAITRQLLWRFTTLIEENNIMGNCNVVMTPRIFEQLVTRIITPGDQTPVWAMGNREPFNKAIKSNVLPNNGTKGTGTNLHSMVGGCWEYGIAAQFGGLHVTHDDVTQALKGMNRIVMNEYHDIGFPRPAAFVKSEDVNPNI